MLVRGLLFKNMNHFGALRGVYGHYVYYIHSYICIVLNLYPNKLQNAARGKP